MRTKAFFLALLLGLSATILCQAQNEEEFFSDDDNKTVVTTDNSKNSQVNPYEEQIKKLEKEKADLKKINDNLRVQADQRAELENKLTKKDQENEKLRKIAEANKAEADSAYKELYDFKMATSTFGVSAENFALAQKDPIPVDSAKTDSVKKEVKKPLVTKVIGTMTEADTAFVASTDLKIVPQIKKGTILLLKEKDADGNEIKIARIRKSDVEAEKNQFAKLCEMGYTLEEVNK